MKSIVQSDNTICYLCHKRIVGTRHEHHVFNGTANRKKSEEDGLKVYLHGTCHEWLHNHPISNRTIKRRVQLVWQEVNNKTEEEFIKRYGKSYL